MKYTWIIGAGMLMLAPAAEEAWLPQIPTQETISQLPEKERVDGATAIKRVMLRRTIRLREEHRRQTRENAAECAVLAKLIGAPQIFVQLMEIEAAEQLGGRDLYDYQQALNKLLSAYGIDALQMRLFVEDLHFTTEELRHVADELPMEDVFNLVPPQELSAKDLEAQLQILDTFYTEQEKLYSEVTNREQADAVVAALIPLMHSFNATAPLRLHLAKYKNAQTMMLYERIVLPVWRKLSAHRMRLIEANYYGSSRLAAFDTLLQ